MKKNGKIILFSVLGLTALALLLKPKKAGSVIPSPDLGGGTGGGGNGNSQVTSGLNYASLANKLFDAFNGFGTREEDVYSVFKMLKTDGDYSALKAAYGNRRITDIYYISYFDGDLPATIKHELDTKELAELNNILAFNNLSVRI
jgi:hypothetical protein